MTPKFHVVTDSAAYLPASLVETYDMDVVPMTIELDGKLYREGIDISPEDFLKKLQEAKNMPTIIAPPVKEWAQLYQKLVREHPYILVLVHSSRLSDAFVNARAAINQVFGRARFWVVDTQTISFGQGVLVQEALKSIEEGMAPPDVVRQVRSMIPHIYAQFLMDRLDYLERFKRVGPAQAVLGTMLGIKPLLTMEDGELIPIEKVLEWEDGIEKLHDFVAEFLQIQQIAVIQHGMDEQTALLLERLENSFEGLEFPVLPYGPTLATHLGPRALGIMVYEGIEQ